MVLKDLESPSFEAGSKQARKTAVVQAAAGERDFSNARGGAGENCGAHEGRMVVAKMGVWGRGQPSLARPQHAETPEREQRFGLEM